VIFTNKYLKKLKGEGGVPLSVSNLFDISSQFFVVGKLGLTLVLVYNYCMISDVELSHSITEWGKTHGYLKKLFRLCCCIYSVSGRNSSKAHLKVRRLFLQCNKGFSYFIVMSTV
jgi:hypothetical protein